MQGYNPTVFQQAIYTLLSGDTTLASMVEGIYSYVPEHTVFPYLLCYIEDMKPYNVAGSEGVEIVFSISCFSQKPGQSELYTVLQQAFETLQDSQPEISGYQIINLRFINSQFDLLNDGLTSRGTLFFRSVLELA